VKGVILAFACVAPLIGGSIEGRVTNAVTGEGISGAGVTFLDRGSHPFHATTDGTGAYHLSGLPDSDYRGEASRGGFTDYRSGAALAELFTGGGRVRVSGDVPVHMDMQLQPWSTVRGRVVDEDGKPAAGISVEISRSLENVVLTDERGEFSFEEIPAGSYTVVAKPKPTARLRGGERTGPVPVYYPSATQLADASPIEVKWGAPAAGIEIRLKSIPVRRVLGTVLDANGKPAAGAIVHLLDRPSPLRQGGAGVVSGPGPAVSGASFLSFYATVAPGPETEMARITSRADGTFEFAAVPRGEWRVAAELDTDDGKPRFGVASAIVGEKDADGVEIRMSGSFSIEVTADWGGIDPPKAKDRTTVPTGYLVSLAGQEGPPQLTFDAFGQSTSVNGVFPGRYRVTRSMGSAGTYVATIMYEGKDVLGQVIELAPGSGPLRAIVKHDGSSLKGVVNGGVGATVVLMPRAAGAVIDYRNAFCGAGGAFEFRDVIPGDYYVAAFAQMPALALSNPADAIAPYSVQVRIDASTPAVPLNLQLNK
jgi:hypothetical protein